jgi:hypothetical protein
MRKWLRWLAAVPVFLCLADGLLWLWATHALSAGLDRWGAQLRAQGWTVQDGGRVAGGWPFAATLAVTDAKIEGGEQAVPGGVSWRATRVVLSVSLLAPDTLSVAPEEQQFLRVSHTQPIIFHADRMEALLPLLGGATRQAELSAQGITGGISGSHHPQDVRMDWLRVHIRTGLGKNGQGKADGMAAELTLRAAQIGLPDIGRWPLGAVVSAVGASVAIYSPKLQEHAPATAEAAAWHAGGGSVALTDTLLKWGPLTLTGAARLGLDDRLQPSGKGTVDVTGAAAALDALVGGGVLQAGLAATAKAVLGAMAQLPGGDAVRLPLVLRDSTLSVGPIPLARLNDIVW